MFHDVILRFMVDVIMVIIGTVVLWTGGFVVGVDRRLTGILTLSFWAGFFFVVIYANSFGGSIR